ncbi:hypothetical protein KIPB_011786 [Kipferlia bialata]|uniref:Uncharacterized protein n=1 Tax=Kipferlia bialata TaxID=797122 RepID=A0A9K3D712_9EUKA|nr:hypothetical protein KIPB_011786 [Kipferlia bialata]|eukprot:g11786.t1
MSICSYPPVQSWTAYNKLCDEYEEVCLLSDQWVLEYDFGEGVKGFSPQERSEFYRRSAAINSSCTTLELRLERDSKLLEKRDAELKERERQRQRQRKEMERKTRIRERASQRRLSLMAHRMNTYIHSSPPLSNCEPRRHCVPLWLASE